MSRIIYHQTLAQGEFKVYDKCPDLENLIAVHQVHSADIVEFKKEKVNDIKADGILAFNENVKGFHFAIKTADCMPVVYIGHKGICVIHAGWVGVRDKILIHPDISKIEPYFCFIGPSICAESFEVQEDFRTQFPNSPYFIKDQDKLTFDLHQEAKEQILTQFPQIELQDCHICTLKDTTYNSYRRDKTAERNWNIFSI